MEPFANKSAAEAAEKEAIALESPVWNIKTNYGDSIAGLTQVAFSAERIADSSSYPYSQEEIYDLGDYAALSVIKGAVGNTPFNTNDLLQTFDITESLAKRLGRAPNPRYLGHLLKRLEGKATPSGIIKRVGKRGDKGIVWAITSRNDGKERAAA